MYIELGPMANTSGITLYLGRKQTWRILTSTGVGVGNPSQKTIDAVLAAMKSPLENLRAWLPAGATIRAFAF